MGSLLRQRIVRWVDSCGGWVNAGTPGAKRVVSKSSKWYGQYRRADGTVARVPLSTNKTAALQVLADLERQVELARAGNTEVSLTELAASIEEHVTACLESLRPEVSEYHLKETSRRLRAVINGAKCHTLARRIRIEWSSRS